MFHFLFSEGNRISIRFHFLEIGFQAVNGRQLPCREEYIRLSLDNTIDPPTVLLCGTYNVTKTTLQWISYGNQLSLQLLSADGKRGRGFHASYRFRREKKHISWLYKLNIKIVSHLYLCFVCSVYSYS